MFGATWYTAGLVAGFGLALGVLVAGLLATVRGGVLVAFLAGLAGGALIGALPWGWEEAAAGGFGGALGGLGTVQLVRGALGRGGTRGATAVLVALGAVVLAVLALVPLLGYVEAVVVPAAARRLSRRAGRTYAGLRILR
ncbi:MAG: hypothetical protein WD249_12435 [Gaiellaceae bacterium]